MCCIGRGVGKTAHDIAVIQKLLKLNGVTENIGNEADLPQVWKHTIPTRFPFSEDRLDRITPIPSFVKNSEVSVAIKNACSDTEISLDKETMELDVKIKRIPLYTFVFPDNENEGNLENLLLQTAESVYPELFALASKYIEEASAYQKKLKKDQNAKKAKVGCIANVMKPGKANQVSIADDDWISEKTLKECSMLAKLNEVLKTMIFEE